MNTIVDGVFALGFFFFFLSLRPGYGRQGDGAEPVFDIGRRRH